MHPNLSQRQSKSILDDEALCKKLSFAKKRYLEHDYTGLIDQAVSGFNFDACRQSRWNPEEFSILYGTPLWDQASSHQRILLNQLYWVAYYSQIVSAEIATIYFNQIASAGMFALEDFRTVSDMLDIESAQERSHISAFKAIGEEVEWELLGERFFTYPMRGAFAETMIFSANNRAKRFWRRLQLKAFALLSSTNAFIASQYLLVRGLRTLNGKLIQHHLSKSYHPAAEGKEEAPIPSAVSYFHFMEESQHFNTSKIIALDIPRSLEPPTAFERWVINRGVAGCQADHLNISVVVNGIFWYEPSLFQVVYRLLRSKLFGMEDGEARNMMQLCFAEETEGLHKSFQLQRTAVESYRAFVEPIPHLNKSNHEMSLMAKNSIARYLKCNRAALKRFKPNAKM